MIPRRRNPFFSGRELQLKQIEEGLLDNNIVVLTGLGGTGKTQIAVEYAFLNRNKYPDKYQYVLWATADSEPSLAVSYELISKELHLFEDQQVDQERINWAVKKWLTTNENWLLVFDNADDVNSVNDVEAYLPSDFNGSRAHHIKAKYLGTTSHTTFSGRCRHNASR